jgi:hypothetical protein
MELVFLGTFCFGFLFAMAAGLLGAAHGSDGHLPAKLALPGKLALPAAEADVALARAADGGLAPMLPRFNLTATMAFLMWFGGAGWLVMHYTTAGVLAACLAGVGAGWPAYRLVNGFYGLLRASETVRRREQDCLDGTLARVTAGAAPGQVGEIVFELNGLRRVEGARTLEGGALEKGDEVVITGYEAGLAIVHPLHEAPPSLPTQASEKALPEAPAGGARQDREPEAP